MKMRKLPFVAMGILMSHLIVTASCIEPDAESVTQGVSVYEQWSAVGKIAAERSMDLIKAKAEAPEKQNVIVVTNAGYAEVNGSSTQGALDGVASVTGASRGRNTLVELQTSPSTTLWFAVFDKRSGYCAYTQVDPDAAGKISASDPKIVPGLFGIESIERIDAEYIFQHPSDYEAKFDAKPFGGNEFRIVTIINGIAAGAPAYVVRAFEFHDHYCPGVTSGILLAEYLKKQFPSGESGYFLHSVEPWCKEDALMVLLNVTPGKGSYAVSYPSDEDFAARVPEAKDAATIIYRQNDNTGNWEGLIMGFKFANPSCPNTGNNIIDKLCADLWYLERMGNPEEFVKVIRRFQLPDETSPEDWAGPGADPLKKLGLAK